MNLNFITSQISSICSSVWNCIISLDPKVISTIVSIIALAITALTLYANTKNNKKNNFDNLFFHLISLLNKIIISSENNSEKVEITLNDIKKQNKAQLETLKSQKIKEYYEQHKLAVNSRFVELENMYLKIESKKLEKIKKSNNTTDTAIPIRKSEFLSPIDDLDEINTSDRSQVYYSYCQNNTTDEALNYPFDVSDNGIETLLRMTSFKSNPSLAIYNIFNSDGEISQFKANINVLKSKYPQNETIDKINIELSELFLHKNMNIPSEISEDMKKDIVNDILLDNKHGSYFRTVHRILKIILDFSKSEAVLNKYCGILRTQLSERHLIILFYNAQYTDRGKKFKNLVAKMNLWGDNSELDVGANSDAIHFATNNLIWKDKDLKILKEEYVRK